ncbi:unnamed protein product (macronuclear) [Paramecium tetraurelia]|uniref:Uncharacterized protein n=1 Tax=Paramecium tetraurelia TaxID=5888 RepID=A0BR51_PARTE|nr:uncharacterized protein GSPATT00031247001 [Paramecium tetraurelia]CAK61018.1 unnamed protein product [Paramecium tetraurelia]|eukprot:XP_001428416.1 hypothetical protein (macronuclear) [Paramecium tetraurelia strain d4-2]
MQKIKYDLITKISQGKEDHRMTKLLVYLTALDEIYIFSGSNSLHLLVEIKVFQKYQNQKYFTIRSKFLKCDLSGSEFENILLEE